jgi:hypothetical protein
MLNNPRHKFGKEQGLSLVPHFISLKKINVKLNKKNGWNKFQTFKSSVGTVKYVVGRRMH